MALRDGDGIDIPARRAIIPLAGVGGALGSFLRTPVGEALIGAAGLGIAEAVAPSLRQGGGQGLAPLGGRGGMMRGRISRALMERVVPRRADGRTQQAILSAYVQLRRAGLGHKAAKRAAWANAGWFLARRRMRSTNLPALRRAIRRVRGARRVLAKVRGLSPGRGRGKRTIFKRRPRRGDIDPFLYAAEDDADYYDEMEDFGYEVDFGAGSFPGGE